MNIFLSGCTGLVGSRLIPRLIEKGHKPFVLTRRPEVASKNFGPRVDVVSGDPTTPGPWQNHLENCDAAINLAGENIFARRWTSNFKKLLESSRILSTRNIASGLMKQPRRADGTPKVLVNASAVGIYGPRNDEEMTEASPVGSDFLSELGVEWEKQARQVETAGIRSVQVRVGVVLDKDGGALAKLLPVFRLFAGGPIGSGKQFMSWIHHKDLVELLLLALEEPRCSGPMNGTAPHPVTNREFARELGQVLHRPSFMWTPAFALRLILGEGAQVITQGQRVFPRKALDLGFQFSYPKLPEALKSILS